MEQLIGDLWKKGEIKFTFGQFVVGRNVGGGEWGVGAAVRRFPFEICEIEPKSINKIEGKIKEKVAWPHKCLRC